MIFNINGFGLKIPEVEQKFGLLIDNGFHLEAI